MIKLTREKPYKGPGIYMIQSSINDKVYIGQSVRISDRVFKSHVKELLTGKHCNRHLQNHVNKHLPDYKCIEDFLEFSVVWRCSKSSLTEMEQEWIDKFPKEQRFNICDKAATVITFQEQPEWRQKEISEKLSISMKKVMNTVESRDNMSKLQKLKWADPIFREKQIEKIKAVMGTIEYKEHLKKAMFLVLNDPEIKIKMSNSAKISQNRPEVKKKKSESLKTTFNTTEAKEKKSKIMKARYSDPKERIKLSERMKARETPEFKNKRIHIMNTPETKKNCSISAKLRWTDPILREKQSLLKKEWWAKRKAKQLEDSKMKRTKFNNQKALEV